MKPSPSAAVREGERRRWRAVVVHHWRRLELEVLNRTRGARAEPSPRASVRRGPPTGADRAPLAGLHHHDQGNRTLRAGEDSSSARGRSLATVVAIGARGSPSRSAFARLELLTARQETIPTGFHVSP